MAGPLLADPERKAPAAGGKQAQLALLPTDSFTVMPLFHHRCLLTTATLALGVACAPGNRASREGRLPAAAAELRAAEAGARAAGSIPFARYALERGLVELGLGNARAADRYLTAAKRAHDADPSLFDDREHGELLSAWRSLGRMPGERR
jgi:hypothetical protein